MRLSLLFLVDCYYFPGRLLVARRPSSWPSQGRVCGVTHVTAKAADRRCWSVVEVVAVISCQGGGRLAGNRSCDTNAPYLLVVHAVVVVNGMNGLEFVANKEPILKRQGVGPYFEIVPEQSARHHTSIKAPGLIHRYDHSSFGTFRDGLGGSKHRPKVIVIVPHSRFGTIPAGGSLGTRCVNVVVSWRIHATTPLPGTLLFEDCRHRRQRKN
jgi:hypothetical protein